MCFSGASQSGQNRLLPLPEPLEMQIGETKARIDPRLSSQQITGLEQFAKKLAKGLTPTAKKEKASRRTETNSFPRLDFHAFQDSRSWCPSSSASGASAPAVHAIPCFLSPLVQDAKKGHHSPKP